MTDTVLGFRLRSPAGLVSTIGTWPRFWLNARIDNAYQALFNTPVTGAVVDNPKDPMGLAVGILTHDLLNQAVEGDNGATGFATAVDLGLVTSQAAR